MIAVSLNVGGGVRLMKPAKLPIRGCKTTTKTKRTSAGRQVCAAMVPYRFSRYHSWTTTRTTTSTTTSSCRPSNVEDFGRI